MSPPPGCVCIDPDWNEIWKARQSRHESSRILDDPSHNWDKKENAERYEENSREAHDPRIQLILNGLTFDHRTRVLDIGAGPGTLAIPLAPHVKEVIAVEPGRGMADILEARAMEQGLKNVGCIRKRWEDIDVNNDPGAPYDLVIASLSLTMHDIREALAKMDAAASGTVSLFWFADMPFWEQMYADLWGPLHGSPYYPGPKADCLFAVLYQMGIHADVEMLPLQKEYRFETRDEMQAFFIRRFGAKTPAQEKIVGDYLTPRTRMDGRNVMISGDSTFAKISWRKSGKG
jgi:SAM-dependent methyltransferase